MFKQSPNLIDVEQLIYNDYGMSVEIDGKWYVARPVGLSSLKERFRLALGVFTGKYDAAVWGGGQ